MKRTATAFLSLTAVLLLPGEVAAQQPRVLGPSAGPDFVQEFPLSSLPPFVHWDLREFPSCQIPWVLGTAPVPDLDGLGLPNTAADRAAATAAFGGAFAAWSGVAPAVIDFVMATAAAPATSGLTMDGHNTLNFANAALDDVQFVAVGGAVAAGGIVVSPGANGVLETQPQGDDVVMGANIVDGGNLVSNTTANNQLAVGMLNAITGIFFSNTTGVILESDVVFNPAPPNPLPGFVWRIYAHGAVPAAGTGDLQTVASHEIGHLIGIGHPINADDVQVVLVGGAVAPGGVVVGPGADGILATVPQGDDVVMGANIVEPMVGGNGTADTRRHNNAVQNPAPNPIMNPIYNPALASNHVLATFDTDSANFLYTPDLGDAPDPLGAVFNRYPSLVHSMTNGRMLNGVQLLVPAQGAEHLFGFFGPDAAPRYQYEWLGGAAGRINDSGAECEAQVPDKDDFDDGVTFGGMFVPGGAAVNVTVNVRTAADLQGSMHLYNAANQMFINGWFDWNADGDWADPGEHAIGGAGGAVAVVAPGANAFAVVAPAGASPNGYARFRLDYREDVGQIARTDPSLDLSTGAAQFGEVEDYKIPACPEDRHRVPTRAVDPEGDDAALIGGLPTHLTLGAAVAAAAAGEVIAFFGRSTENVTINKGLTVTQCTIAQITAANAAQPVVDINAAAKVTIIGLDTVGGTIGWRVGTNNHELRGVRASKATQFGISVVGNNNSVSYNSLRENAVGIGIAGSTNDVRGGTVEDNTGNGAEISGKTNTFRTATVQSNKGNGILVSGEGNTVRDNRINTNTLNGIRVTGKDNTILSNQSDDNTEDGIQVTGPNNTIRDDKANRNTGDGFDISGGAAATANKLRGNQSNQGNSGGSGENAGAEYRLLDTVKNDGGGNKADTIGVPKTTVPKKCEAFPATNATKTFAAAHVCE